jgi:hypothetical protein
LKWIEFTQRVTRVRVLYRGEDEGRVNDREFTCGEEEEEEGVEWSS